VIAAHVLDDNFVQPQPGTSAGDHLASGFVPIAMLAAVATMYARLRAGLRAGLRAITVMTLGALGVTIGVPSAYYLLDGTASGDR
jgi:hypothetical protein